MTKTKNRATEKDQNGDRSCFCIQNTQNRDAKAVHLKLDELIRALSGARNKLVDLEKLSDDELKAIEAEFEKVRATADRANEKISEMKEEAKSR